MTKTIKICAHIIVVEKLVIILTILTSAMLWANVLNGVFENEIQHDGSHRP